MAAYTQADGRALRQGDILTGVVAFSPTSIQPSDETLVAAPLVAGDLRSYDFAVVVAQDCDLEQDYAARFSNDGRVSADKKLFGILLCAAYDENLVRAGKHRDQAKTIGSKEWKPLVRNQEPRYQCLGFVPQANKRLIVDFKDYFTIPCGFLYDQIIAGAVTRRAQMCSPYKEHLLQRFAWFLMRIGLPIDFDDLPGSL